MWIFRIVGLFILMLTIPAPASAQVRSGAVPSTVTVTENNQGIRVVGNHSGTVRIVLDPAATAAVWIDAVDAGANGADNCTAAMTSRRGTRLSRGNDKDYIGYFWGPEDSWYGQICAIGEGQADQILIITVIGGQQ